MRHLLVATFALIATAPVSAQMPGAPELSRVEAGRYQIDPNHTQVLWTVNHMGITPLHGAFGQSAGTLTIDPKAPNAAKVEVTFPISGLTVTSPGFMKHLSSPDFFDASKYPEAKFVSTSVVAQGSGARITGNLTLHGVTRPVTLDASFFGAGANAMNQKLNIGFKASATIRRSEFGLGMAVPVVSDEVALEIVAAFEKEGAPHAKQ
jgi:polyisoprenoid-binding protein YceI